MSNHLGLSNYELNLVSNGLQIMLIQNAKNSKEITEKQSQHQHESLGLELFALFSKVKRLDTDKDMDLSAHELKLMKNGLMFLADYTYQKSLQTTESSKTQHYEKCNLQFINIRSKINRMESQKMC